MLHDVKQLFLLSFKITTLKEEQLLLEAFHAYIPNKLAENLSDYLYEAFLVSNVDNLQQILVAISETGLKSYINWKLSFPYEPKIEFFSSELVNGKLFSYEKEIEICLLKILIFLRENFAPLSDSKYAILLPFLRESVLNRKFGDFNLDYRMEWYGRYCVKVEKILLFKYLFYSCAGTITTNFEKHRYYSHKNDSDLAKNICLINNKILDFLCGLQHNQTLNYQVALVKLFEKYNHPYPKDKQIKAYELEKQYTDTYAKNIVKFRNEDDVKVFSALSPYFIVAEHDELMKLLRGKIDKVEKKLIFQQTAKTLTHYLKNIHQDGLLQTTSKQKLGRWIEENFCCLVKGQPREIKINTIEKYLKPENKPPLHIISID